MNKRDRWNAYKYFTGESGYGLLNGLIAPYTILTFLLHHHGAGETMIGSIFAIKTGFTILPQILGNYIFKSVHSRKRLLVLFHIFLIATPYLCMGVIVFLSHLFSDAFVRWALLLSFAFRFLMVGVVLAVWMDWVAHLFHHRIRGSVMGWTWGGASLAGSVAALAAGWLIKLHPQMSTYGWLYMVAGVLAMAFMIPFALIKDPALEEPDRQLRLKLGALVSRFRLSLMDRNYRSFLLGRWLGILGFTIVPFIAIYYSSAVGGGLTDGTIVASGAAMNAGMACSTILLGKLGDRKGHRIGLLIGTMMQIVTLLILLFSSGTASCIIAYAGAGLCIGSRYIAGHNMMFETCTHDNRMAHITAGNLVLSVVSIGGPLLAGSFAGRWGLRPLFGVSLVFSIMSFIWIFLLVKEPRTVSPSVGA